MKLSEVLRIAAEGISQKQAACSSDHVGCDHRCGCCDHHDRHQCRHRSHDLGEYPEPWHQPAVCHPKHGWPDVNGSHA